MNDPNWIVFPLLVLILIVASLLSLVFPDPEP